MERLKGEGVQEWLGQHLTSPWHGHQTVASELGNDILLNIRERFSQLDPPVRLGVLFSLISLKKAQQVELKDRCQELIDHASSDVDEWVRLVSKMLQNYPSQGTLRFDVEQFSDQEQLKTLLQNLTNTLNRDGINFHAKESAFLDDSVCRLDHGKDPKTGELTATTGPSLQHHFNCRNSRLIARKERSEKLKALATQGGPSLPIPVSTTSSLPSVSNAGTSSALGISGSSGLGARPGRQPSFLMKKPKPQIARNPSTGLMRNAGPTSGSRPIHKASRIQILDIQQGAEIMQSITDTKKKLEDDAQREKDLKKEQRVQELEQRKAEAEHRKQADLEKKAQAQKEKDDKKKKAEELKKAKAQVIQNQQSIYLQLARDERDREVEEANKADNERKRNASPSESGRNSPMLVHDDEADVGGTSASADTSPTRMQPPARKKSKANASKAIVDDDDDYDNESETLPRVNSNDQPPLSPMTPTISNMYARHGISDDGPTPGSNNYTQGGPASSQPTPSHHDSYFPAQSANTFPPDSPIPSQSLQQQQQQPPGPAPAAEETDVSVEHPTLFQHTNQLTKADRDYIKAFLNGQPVVRPVAENSLYQITMNQELIQDASGRAMYELILIEMDFDTGAWRKLKRRRKIPEPIQNVTSAESSAGQ